MNKRNLANIRRTLGQAASFCADLKEFVGEIPDGPRRHQAEQIWMNLHDRLEQARGEMKKWKIGYPKGRRRIGDDRLEAIRQWKAQPYPEPKVRTLAQTLGLSPTTVYAVLKEVGWRKAAR